jgi:hypothetical protein
MNVKLTSIITAAIICSFIILNGAVVTSAYTGASCGDDYCTTEYGEADPTNLNYCPLDCGIRTSSSWCDTTYSRSCPDCSCTSCPTCDTSRLSSSDLGNWCSSNGYSPGSSSPTEDNKYYWLIFLVIGLIGGYYYKKKR